MSADTPKHWLDCPDCSCRVFARVVDLFGDGESEHCAACGSLVTISTDAESPLDVRVDEHGGAVVARLLDEVERLTGELATLEFPGQYWKDEAFAHEQRADKLEVEVARLRERAGTWEKLAEGYYERALAAEGERDEARAVAQEWRTKGWGDPLGKYKFPWEDDGTPTAATPSPPDNIEIAWSALRVAASRHGSAPVRGVDVDLHAAIEMALAEARGATPSMTGPEFIAAARKSGLFTAEAVEEIRADIARQRGATPPEPGGES